MKKNFLVLFSLLISFSVFSQQDSIVNYLDRYYEKVKKEQATYIQTIVKNKSLWLATVYHGNGKIKLQGNFKKKNLKTRIGLFRVFDDKGNLKFIQNYNAKGKKHGVYAYYNKKGERITKGYFLEGNKEGVWKYLDQNKMTRARIVFKKGEVLDYDLWNEEGITIKENLIISRRPEYNGGRKQLDLKLKNELMRDLRKSGYQTNFILKCTIDTNGNVRNISVTPTIDEEFENKITTYFKDFEGIQSGIIANMKVEFPLEIPFIFN